MRAHEMIRVAFVGALASAGTIACDGAPGSGGVGGDPCERYVDYMCQCHDEDPDADCEELKTIYGDPDPDLEDQCSVELEEQQAEDEQTGEDCDTGAGA